MAGKDEQESGLPAQPRFTYLRPYGAGDRYSLNNLYRGEGSDDLYLYDPDGEVPREAKDGDLSWPLNKRQMTELRDAFTARLENWGKP